MSEFAAIRKYFDSAPTPSRALWGKARPRDPLAVPAHPLLFHMIDVFCVCSTLLRAGLSISLRRRIAEPVAGSEESAIWLVSLLAALHDIGKASPSFQMKWPEATPMLMEMGLGFPSRTLKHPAPHGTLSFVFLAQILREEMRMSPLSARRLARAVGGHHGEFPIHPSRPLSEFESGVGESWNTARRELVTQLLTISNPSALPPIAWRWEMDHAFRVLLAGLTSVSDWIASMDETFPYEWPSVDPSEYVRIATDRAAKAVREIGMHPARAAGPRSFAELFPPYAPWPLHETAEMIAAECSAPGALILIEAPMGEGKTEAALFLADAFANKHGQDGLFFGLPTQATANQMFIRVARFLARTRQDRGSLELVHGEAFGTDLLSRLIREVYDSDDSPDDGGLSADEWFARPKRALLANVAIGTVDQALLGVLPVRHGFIRLFGLAGKVVILDEIHAYDTYTSTLIDRLVQWLQRLGATTVLLSATLPRSRRAELLNQVSPQSSIPDRPYPRVSVADASGISVRTFSPRQPRRAVRLDCLPDDLTAAAERLSQAVSGGGCAGWICNTVGRAQDAFTLLREARHSGALSPRTDIHLLHSRLTKGDRLRREREVAERLGPGGMRPAAAIVVGTQVLEQSLDIDFDILATDLAPIDLLLQRSGRLHRHDRGHRPGALSTPRLIVCGAGADGPPPWALQGVVYAAFPQLRTWKLLQSFSEIRLPDDIEPLIEAVYRLVAADDSPEERALAERDSVASARDSFLAAQCLLPEPDGVDDPLEGLRVYLSDDDSDLHRQLRAQTRLGGPRVDLVCLHTQPRGVSLDRAGGVRIDLSAKPTPEAIRRIQESSIGIGSEALARQLLALPVPAAWVRSAVLRHRRVLELKNGVGRIAGLTLSLDDDLGLVVAHEEGI